MTKREWLNETVFVDEYGRPYNLSDVPMTYMKRKEAYTKQRFDDKKIDILYQEDIEDLEIVKEQLKIINEKIQ